jgi:hypothetical protein
MNSILFTNIICVVVVIVLIIPTIKFWKFSWVSGFACKSDLIIYTATQIGFNVLLYTLFSLNWKINEKYLSFIPAFLITHLLYFSVLSVLVIIPYSAEYIRSKLFSHANFTKKAEPKNRIVKLLLSLFDIDFDLSSEHLLSAKVSRPILILSYIISGILTVSDTANALTYSFYQRLLTATKTVCLNSNFVKETFSRDLSLYSNTFITALVPILISAILQNRKTNS